MRTLALLAALVASCLVACGDDGQTLRDAGTGDGDADGSSTADADIDADPNVRGTVTVQIVDKNDAPLAGFYVVFIDTDATVTERTTDSAGMAQADVFPNATVTAIRNRNLSYALVTVQALNPGDTIKLISAPPSVSPSEDPFSDRTVPMPGADLAAAPTKVGQVATFTTVAPHGLVADDRVIIANVNMMGYNGNWTVNSAPTTTTFTATITDPNAPVGTPGKGATAMKGVAFTVNYSAFAGAQNYQVHTRCGTVDVGNVTSAALVLPIGCASSPQDIEVLAKNNAGATLAWTQQPSVNVTSGGSTAISDTWHAPAALPVAYSNITQEISKITVARFSPYGRGLPTGEVMQATAGTLTLPAVSFPSRATMYSSFLGPSTGSGTASQRTAQIVDGTATQLAHDIAANLLPWVKATYVPATSTIEVTVDGTGSYDIFEANLSRRYRMVGPDQYIYTWRVFGPVAQSVTFPTLPTTAPGDPTIRPTDTMGNTQVFIGESDAINGYRAAIKNPFEALGTCEASTNATVKPYGGTKNRISQWN